MITRALDFFLEYLPHVFVVCIAAAGGYVIWWHIKHKCIEKVPSVCTSMNCAYYDSNGTCTIWLPVEYHCMKCIKWEDR